jgi:peptidoglycan/xylan/chitin deacetylase (PgdA/CDA1 family)
MLPAFFPSMTSAQKAEEARLVRQPGFGVPQGIVVRTTENVTKGGWVYLLNRCEALGITRIDLLVKQDEDHFESQRTGETLQSGDLLVPLPGEECAKGWEDPAWLHDMFAKAKEKGIEIWAWWPCFHDAAAGKRFPTAAYSSSRGEQFVDPGVPEVRERQEALIAKLLDTYPFAGVSLDWIRYEGWYAGSKGPLGKQFERQYRFQWEPGVLDNEYSKARWYEIRSRLLANWVGQLVREMRTVRPGVRWGAFLLPWHFSEASQSYPMLGAAGLDYLQPMCYWPDWKKQPEWVGETSLSLHGELASGTTQWATLGIDAPLEEIQRAIASIPPGSVGGLSWFTFGTWEEKCFRKIHEATAKEESARRFFGFAQPLPNEGWSAALSHKEDVAAPSFPRTNPERIKPKVFPEESSVWAVVALAELHRRGALAADEKGIVPVLALHSFAEGGTGSQNYLYRHSTGYVDALLKFIRESGFSVCPLSRLQSHLITRDPSFLPPKPLVITLDDGSESVYKFFYPRAQEFRVPFTLALVTSWLGESDATRHSSDEAGVKMPTMTWQEAKEMNQSGLAEIISHSDAMHYQTSEAPMAAIERPAEISRQLLKEFGRAETTGEYSRRIRADMLATRTKLVEHGFRAPSIFCWPYGATDTTATAIAQEAGFTHFLLFDTPPVLATPSSSRQGIPRIAVLRPDEFVPLSFPTDPAEQQEWWLAFLKVASDSQSPALITATLRQLTEDCQQSPEAEIARAARDYLRGNAPRANVRLLALHDAYSSDGTITGAIDATLKQFNAPPQ